MKNAIRLSMICVFIVVVNLTVAAQESGAQKPSSGVEKAGVKADKPSCGKNSCDKAGDGFVSLYNGQNLDGWKVICRHGGEKTARKIFTPVEDGVLHVYKDFPDGYQLDAGKNDTHALIITDKKYSRFIFSFEYKWGHKKLNNFSNYQYDAGAFYHIYNEKVWPRGIEYQVRYNHKTQTNHTGDVWNCGAEFKWYEGPGDRFLAPADGGKQRDQKGGEHRGLKDVAFNALNDQWNVCEMIVMADTYAIHKLNGQVVNYITDMNLREGTVALQAETAELFYRNIKIKEFDTDRPASEFLGQ